ncbi:MAG: hypothetical protein SH848_16260 [Saprospiraceae bacterium]|nr:hypothetical protein [Saprospiraceae bacterium]MDZ4705479.1 hypothetical protein [Saprospiraceae bacterium]
MNQSKRIRISVFLALLAMFSIALQQGHAAVSQLRGANHAKEDGVYLTVNTPDFISVGEQKNGFSLQKTVGKPSFQTRLSSWLGNPAQYRNGDVAAVRYFLASINRVVSLEPPDLVFPFHDFW